jgi:pimeloyl-ACP methyl ester carboxylesterase
MATAGPGSTTVGQVSTPPFVDLPAGVRADRWRVRGGERAVLHAGPRDARAWVLLVPGFTGSKEDFIAVLPLLAEAGVGAVAFDQLGQFESDASADPSDYAVPELALDLAGVVAAAGERFDRAQEVHVVGHSFGGLVVQEAVAGGVVRPASLTLLCTGPGALPRERWAGLPDLVDALAVADLAEIWRIMRQMEQAEDPVPPAPAVAAFLEARWHANSPVQLAAFAQHLMHQPDLVDRLVPRVADGLPTRVIWGEADDAWPIAVQADMARRLGAQAVELPGVGHSPNAEAPALTAQALLAGWAR